MSYHIPVYKLINRIFKTKTNEFDYIKNSPECYYKK